MSDISAEAVERLAARMESAAAAYKATADCCGETCSAGVCAAPACSFGNIMAGLQDGVATLRALLAERDRLREALIRAKGFIVNGMELGFIRMPDSGTPDPAHETLPTIIAALGETGHE